MLPRKNYIAPFWWLLVLAVIKIALLLLIIIIVRQSSFNRSLSRSYFILHIGQVMALIIEAAVYRYIRKLPYRRLLAKWHIGLWYAAVLLMPIAFVIIQYSSLWSSPETHDTAINILRSVSNIFFWTCIVIGHLFFGIAVSEALKNRKKEEPEIDLFESV